MDVDPEFLQEAIVDEVARQLKPFQSLLKVLERQLDSISEWKDELYANGSGKKLGYFERSRSEDLHRWNQMENLVASEARKRMEAEIRRDLANENAAHHKQRAELIKLIAEIGVVSVPGLWALFHWLSHHPF